ncbi:MAG: NUDIX hydrolase [Thermoplasmata archaeon]|nr:MAG: NUDIX hydrolase [Thermoplasmata archaeon]
MSNGSRNTCGGILIKNNKILLGKRKSDRLYPDIWDIFGGHIESSETKEETLFRELKEEIGIEVKDHEFLESYQDKDPTFGIDYIHHIYIVHSWEGTPENKNPREHESIQWFSKAEIDGLPMHGEVKRIILENVIF